MLRSPSKYPFTLRAIGVLTIGALILIVAGELPATWRYLRMRRT